MTRELRRSIPQISWSRCPVELINAPLPSGPIQRDTIRLRYLSPTMHVRTRSGLECAQDARLHDDTGLGQTKGQPAAFPPAGALVRWCRGSTPDRKIWDDVSALSRMPLLLHLQLGFEQCHTLAFYPGVAAAKQPSSAARHDRHSSGSHPDACCSYEGECNFSMLSSYSLGRANSLRRRSVRTAHTPPP